MEIILKTDVENLGYKDQIVNVKPGFANNYLIPQGMATNATASAKKAHEELLRQRAHKEAKIIADAQAVADKLAAMTIVLSVKANKSGKIFGSVTTTDIAEAVAAKGIEVDKRNLKVVEAIKEVGTHSATIRLYKEIVATIAIEVISNDVEEVAAPAVEDVPAAE
ncbi:MAG: 50S ribosomal protein L9 [Rikenellaceae bacterium]